MTIRFEVTGETPEQFAQNALQAFGVLAVGLQTVAAQLAQQHGAGQPPSTPQSSTPPSPSAPEEPTTDTPTMEPLENPKVMPSTQPPASGPEKGSQPSKSIKPEDISKRLGEVIVAAAGRGWSTTRRNAYARQLLASIGGAKKVTDLDTEEKRADFMGNSETFLVGLAKEDLDDEIGF